MRKYVGWLFLIAFIAFAAWIRETNMMYLNPNNFIILWMLASFIVVWGVLFFRNKTDKDTPPRENDRG